MAEGVQRQGRGAVLAKAVAVLFAFRVDDVNLSLAELGRRTGLPKATAHRVVGDLVDAGMLDRIGTDYRLSGRVFELGMRASVERTLLEVAMPFLQDLAERTHETVHLGVLDGISVVYIAKVGGHRQVSAPSRVGGRMPAHCTAVGKAMLAYSPPPVLAEVMAAGLPRRTPRTITAPGLLARQLEMVATTGLAFEHEESAVGITCVAAAVLGADEAPVAAISVTGPVTRFRAETAGPVVRVAAAGLASVLARRATPA